MSEFKQTGNPYINWRDGYDGRDLPSKQSTAHNNAPADDEAASDFEDQVGTTPSQRRGKRSRRRGRSRSKNKNARETVLTGQDQVQEITESIVTTPAERDAAATQFWATARPATLFGFLSNAGILAANLANETRNRSTAEHLLHTVHFQEVHHPVEEGENPFDPHMSSMRTVAILGGSVEKRKDVGQKKKKDWARERYVFADIDEPVVKNESRKEGDLEPPEGLTPPPPHGMKKWEWYGKKLRKDAARDAKKAVKREAAGRRGITSFHRGNLTSNTSDWRPSGDDRIGDTGYDHGGFQDTDEFYTELVPKLENLNPEAKVFQPGCKPSSG